LSLEFSLLEPQAEAAPSESRKKELSLRLTRRDFEILAMLLEQGFLTLEAVYLAFFDNRKDSSLPFPPRLEVTRQRLRLLEKAGLIQSQPVPMEAKGVYLLTRTGRDVLSEKLPSKVFGPVPRFVDLGAYEHDKAVTFCRIALEKSGKASHWYPERRTKAEGFSRGHKVLDEKLVPDGIFVSPKGAYVALEVEPARKAKERYQEKMSYYRSAFAKEILDKILYVTRRPDIAKVILETSGNNDRVLLENYDHFLSRLFPQGERP
jgi:hypothetical protein